jgi:hypothetical protein
MFATGICNVENRDYACEAILAFLMKHPRARFNRKALLTIGWMDGGHQAEQAVDYLLEAGVIGREEDGDLLYLAQ